MLRLTVASAAALSLAACVTPYAPIPYDRASAGIQTIVVVEDSLPADAGTQKLATNGENMASAMAASAGLAGVLVGAIAAGVDANIEAGQRTRIQAALATQGFDGEAIFDAALESALAANGYELGKVTVERKNYREPLELEVRNDLQPGSAILDVAGAGYGYQLVGGNTQWRPFVTVGVRLSDPADPSKIHLDNRVVYNPVATPDVIVNLPPDPQYAFAKVEDIEADPAKAKEGLEKALVETANAVADLLN